MILLNAPKNACQFTYLTDVEPEENSYKFVLTDHLNNSPKSIVFRIRANSMGHMYYSYSNSIEASLPGIMWVPNCISPNNDNLNDILRPKTIGVSNYEIEVFNRWGEQLYVGEEWDGTYLGSKVEQGVYFVNIIYETSEGLRRVYNGSVMVIY